MEEPFVGVEKPFLGVEHPFKGVDKPWTSRRMPPQPEIMQVKVAELKPTELNCATFSKTKDDSKRA